MLHRVIVLAGFFALTSIPGWGAVEFNRDIRPILSDKCFACHGPDSGNRKTKMRLDREDGAKIALTGGRSALIPGDPEHSEIYRRVSSDNKTQRMPPAYAGKDRLSDKEIGLIRDWIAQGAQWEAHWSFIPPKRPAVPEAAGAEWAKNPIDHFVAARLQQQGLHPAKEADRATLIRRVTLDLTGLPPAPQEVQAFVQDHSAGAYERVVDRLLASPRFAERMAFRWMEAARYADTNGYQTDGPREMWRWRDWVLDAFRKNMPFDEFTVDQIAGDLLPHATLDQKVATAFLRNHRTNAEGGIVPEEFRSEYVSDRAETTSNVWLALTVGCARCHDHKYDPITQKDYYSLYAYFNNVPEQGLVYNWGNDDPMIKAPTPPQQVRLAELQDSVKEAQSNWDKLGRSTAKAQTKWEREIKKTGALDWTVKEGLVYQQPEGAKDFDGKQFYETEGEFANFDFLDPFTFAAWIKPDADKGAILSHSEDFFEGQGHGLYVIDGKLRLHVIFRWTDIGVRVESAERLRLHAWQHVAVTYDGKRKGAGVKMYVDGRPIETKVLFEDLNWPMKSKAPFRIGAGGGLRFQGSVRDARVYARALTPDEAGIIAVDRPVSTLVAIPAGERTAADSNKLRACFLERASPPAVRAAEKSLRDARKALSQFEAQLPTVMVMVEGKPRETHVLRRGAYDAPGDRVTEATPAVLPKGDPSWPRNRLGLAKWIVDRSNPLTARVAVNRYWQMYFGTGLVKTVEDFGSQGEWPMQQDLLDWLAVDFMESGWDVKAMQRRIVTSATYRQDSNAAPELLQRDPENRLLARGPRMRLGPDMIRDQALAVSGLLVEKLGGPSVKPYQPPGLWQELADSKGGYEADKGEGLYRRSLYTYWKRTVAPPFMVNFDSPNREMCTVRENRTNTPLQALDLMNDEAFTEASRRFAERMMREGGATPEQRIDYGYRVMLARTPKPAEKQVLLATFERFLKRYADDSKAAEEYLSYGESARDRTIPAAELAAYTTLSSLMLNLNEAITKQ